MARRKEPLVEYADGDEASAFAMMLGGLIEANVGRPEKREDFESLTARVGIQVRDIDESVTLDFKGGKLPFLWFVAVLGAVAGFILLLDLYGWARAWIPWTLRARRSGAVRVSAPESWAPELNRLAAGEGITLAALGVAKGTLEEAFFAITRAPDGGAAQARAEDPTGAAA